MHCILEAKHFRIGTSLFFIPHVLKHTWNILQDKSYINPPSSLIKFKKIEITSRIFYDHSGVKLEISNQKKMKKKITNMWKLNHMLLNNHWVKEEIKREIRNYLQTNEKENMTCKNLWNVKQTKKKNHKPQS